MSLISFIDVVVPCVRVFTSSVSVFFFFKQKTAYEMRISDWSSDVCSSDLPRHNADDQACDSNDARSWRRFHHQHQFGRIADRRSLRSSLCIIKIGDQYAHEICRHTIWEDQYSLQCGLAWAHPHSDSARQRSTRSVRYL